MKDLREIYTPIPGDIAFVATRARGPSQKFALKILLKAYQRLHYFPEPLTIPGVVISHIRAVMKLPADLVPDIAPATLYRYYMALREHLEITTYQGKQVRHVAARAMHQAAQVMNNPADIINAAIETLLNEHCELPAFSTLDRMARHIRTLVNGGIYQLILARLSETERQALSALLAGGVFSVHPVQSDQRTAQERYSHPSGWVALSPDLAAIVREHATVDFWDTFK